MALQRYGLESARLGRRSLLGAALVLSLAACEVDGSPVGLFAAQDAVPDAGGQDAHGGDAGPPAADAEGGVLVPTGTWLLYTEVTSCVSALTVHVEEMSESLNLVQLDTLPDGSIHHRERACLTELSPVVGVKTLMPPPMLEALPESSYEAVTSGFEPGARYLTPVVVDLWGAVLDDPWNDPLPTQIDDPRVRDTDGDGFPGVTLSIEGGLCDVRIVHRNLHRYDGTIVSPTRIEGYLDAGGEQNVLDATSGFCKSHSEVRYEEPTAQRFVLLRVDGVGGALDLDTDGDGAVSCEEIRAYGLTAFGPRPPDDSRCEHAFDAR